MPVRAFRLTARGPRALIVMVWAVAVAMPRAQTPAAADILRKAGEYLADYEKQFAAVVSEEHYEQTTTRRNGVFINARRRELKSDVILISSAEASWLTFRDVFEVDGRSVRDRDQRLQKLFLETPSQAMVQAKRIMNESARYNVGSLQRNVNVPTMALTYLRLDHQARSAFTMGGGEKISGTGTRVFSFKEHAAPTVIRSGSQDLPAAGRFWIDPATGRVVKSELTVQGAISKTRISVTYASQPKLSIWVPVDMQESYALVMNNETIGGHAKYSNFRQFKVTVTEAIK